MAPKKAGGGAVLNMSRASAKALARDNKKDKHEEARQKLDSISVKLKEMLRDNDYDSIDGAHRMFVMKGVKAYAGTDYRTPISQGSWNYKNLTNTMMKKMVAAMTHWTPMQIATTVKAEAGVAGKLVKLALDEEDKTPIVDTKTSSAHDRLTTTGPGARGWHR